MKLDDFKVLKHNNLDFKNIFHTNRIIWKGGYSLSFTTIFDEVNLGTVASYNGIGYTAYPDYIFDESTGAITLTGTSFSYGTKIGISYGKDINNKFYRTTTIQTTSMPSGGKFKLEEMVITS